MKIEPRTLKGFRDFLPEEMKLRSKVMSIIESVFEKYGYEPIETPALEYFDILMDKYGEEEKLVYNFDDFGGRRVALKYDLTVPTARVFAQYQNEITLPWKRYQMQPVWRADNTQRGRYREFWQCDADIIGSADVVADSEFIKMGIEILEKLGFKEFEIKLSNRKILNAISQYINRQDKFEDIVYAIDKWDKRDITETQKDLTERGLKDKEIQSLFDIIDNSLEELTDTFKDIEEGQEGVKELQKIIDYVGDSRVNYDPTIARGLAYYTGPIWEWNIVEGNIGSVGGAGRYDKLIGTFTGIDTPATGGSFGIERIIDVIKERSMMSVEADSNKILVTILDEKYVKEVFAVADEIRSQGFIVEVYPDSDKKFGKQMDYADKKGFDYAVIIGEEEINENKISAKNLQTGEQDKYTIHEFLEKLK